MLFESLSFWKRKARFCWKTESIWFEAGRFYRTTVKLCSLHT